MPADPIAELIGFANKLEVLGLSDPDLYCGCPGAEEILARAEAQRQTLWAQIQQAGIAVVSRAAPEVLAVVEARVSELVEACRQLYEAAWHWYARRLFGHEMAEADGNAYVQAYEQLRFRAREASARLEFLAATLGASGEGKPGGDGEPGYVRARVCRNDRVTTHKMLKSLLNRLPNNEGGIRRYYRGQHLYVHAEDWLRWHGEQDRQASEALDRSAETIAKIRAAKEAKKTRRK